MLNDLEHAKHGPGRARRKDTPNKSSNYKFVNEHFEFVFNAVSASTAILRWAPKKIGALSAPTF
jgi:hypothetical protein